MPSRFIPVVALSVACGGRTAIDMPGNSVPTGVTASALQAPDAQPGKPRVSSPLPRFVWHTQLLGSAAADLPAAVALNRGQSGAIIQGGETTSALVGAFQGGLSDGYVVAYDLAGNRIWSDQFGTGGDDSVTAVASDAQGNVYITGLTEGTLPGATPNPRLGFDDIFLRKYDSAGHLLWTRQLGSTGEDTPNGIALDSSGSAYIVGVTDALLPGALSYSGGDDMFILKYSPAGNLLAVHEAGSAGNDDASAVAIGPDGRVNVAGFTDGSFAGSPIGGFDVFVEQLDAQLRQIWIDREGSPGDDRAAAIAINDARQVFVAGTTTGNLVNGAHQGGSDVVVLGYDRSGRLSWADQRGTSGSDSGSGITVNAAGAPLTVGFTSSSLDGLPNAGGNDLFLMEHGRQGRHQWTSLLGTSGNDIATAVAFDPTGHEYVVGYTDGDLDGVLNAGSFDGFTAKFDAVGTLE